MGRIVVLGAGICGLAASLILHRDGHDVTVLERDPAPVPDSLEDAWERWERGGVVQFRQAHFLQPRGRAVLDSNLPGLRKNPNYFLFQGFTLRQLAGMSGGKITQAKLESVRADLAATPSGPAAAVATH